MIVLVQQEVLRLKITMCDGLAMHVLQHEGHLGGVEAHQRMRQSSYRFFDWILRCFSMYSCKVPLGR